MSAIHNNRNDQSRIARQAQADYNRKEQELVKKHRKEMARLNQRHADRVREIKQGHEEYVGDLKEKSRKSFSERDLKFQSDIQDLRDMQREQLRSLASKHEEKQKLARRTHTAEMKNQKEITERQRQSERRQARTNIDNLKEEFEGLVESNRDQQKASQRELRRKLEDARNEEKELLISGHTKRIGKFIEERDNERHANNREIKNLKTQLMNQKETLHKDFAARIATERENHDGQIEVRDMELDRALNSMKGKYQGVIDEERERSENARDYLRETVLGRQQEEVNHLEREVEFLSSDNVSKLSKMKAQQKRERDTLIGEYEKQKQVFERQRDEALKTYKDTNSAESDALRKEYGQRFRALNRFYLDKINALERTQDERLSSVMIDAENEKKHAQGRHDLRVERIRSEHEVEKEGREKHFELTLDQIKQDYQEALKDVRNKANAEKKELISRFQTLIRENENSTNQKLSQTMVHNDKEVQSLRDRHLREVRGLVKKHEHLLSQQTRKNTMDKETMKIQFREQLRQMQNAHDEEIQRINARHEEETQQLLSVVRKG